MTPTPFVCDRVDMIAVSNGLVARKDTYLDGRLCNVRPVRCPS